jgi:hypothetical protein
MLVRELLIESEHFLFHKTEAKNLNGIVAAGQIDVSSPDNVDPAFDYDDYGGVSMTRNSRWYHYNDEANSAVIVLKAQAIRKFLQGKEHVWSGSIIKDPTQGEQEVRVNKPIPFTPQFIQAVRIEYNATHVKPETISKIKKLGIPVRVK